VRSLCTGPYRIENRRASVNHDGRRVVDVVRYHLNGSRGRKSRKRRWKNWDHRSRSRSRSNVRHHVDGSRANIDRYVIC